MANMSNFVEQKFQKLVKKLESDPDLHYNAE